VTACAAHRAWSPPLICFLYGFANISGSQFTVLDSELTRPLGEVSGFWLTWHYFGYSAAYGNGIATLQILAGVLLVLPRTALAGALLLLPVVINIVVIDVRPVYSAGAGGRRWSTIRGNAGNCGASMTTATGC
jgi:hypothetical protein